MDLSGTVSIDTHIQFLPNEGDALRAFVAPPGVVVYGKSKGEVIDKADEVTRFLLHSILTRDDPLGSLRSYLDHHGVRYSLESDTGAENGESTEEVVVQRGYPVVA